MEALRSALDPVEALRGEHSQLETWVRESFATLDALHDELAQWQSDLNRQQAEVDKQAAASDSDAEARLAAVREDCRLLEEENAEQLQTLEELERQLLVAQTELRTARQHADELSAALDAERERASGEQRMWTGELREMRHALERQTQVLASLGVLPSGAEPPHDAGAAESPRGAGAGGAARPETEPGAAAAARAAELRRRASSRRAQRPAQ
ncbi:MAG TPA: hypothetical protein VEQ85_16650 [Lacipirellulaceae bacterium]|nr:hypothetical protein [Lacipirellulaceae bacterium]